MRQVGQLLGASRTAVGPRFFAVASLLRASNASSSAPSGDTPSALEDADERNLRVEQLLMHLRAREVPGLRAGTRDHFPEGCSELAFGFVIVLERVIQCTLCMAKQFRVKAAIHRQESKMNGTPVQGPRLPSEESSER